MAHARNRAEQFMKSTGWQTMKRLRATPDDLLRVLDMTTPPVDIRLLVERMGIDLIEQPIDKPWCGQLDSSEDEAAITVNTNQAVHEVRRRFTIAHECGHLMLHGAGRKFRDVNFVGDNPQDVEEERQANRFAAALLAPPWMVESYAGIFNYGTDALARLFVVSKQTLEIQMSRIMRIGL